MESSRTYFEVLGLEIQVLGLRLKAYKSSKMSCSWFWDSTVFESLKMGHGHDLLFTLPWKTAKNLAENLRKLFFGEPLRFVSLILGLEHSCPWP